MICLWCNIEKEKTEFYKNSKHCKKCHNLKYSVNNKKRKTINIICPCCNKERKMRQDAYKKRKSDMCIKCSPLHNEQLFVSEHKLDTKHPIYKRWCYMKQRCSSEDKKKWYKDKGIKVCDEWQNYSNFYKWSIENGFDINLELDRINENFDYHPNNCQWITHRENTLKIKKLFGKI